MELSVFSDFFELPNVVATALAAAGVHRYSRRQQIEYDRQMLVHTADQILSDIESYLKETEVFFTLNPHSSKSLCNTPFCHRKFVSAAITLLDDDKLLMGNKAKNIRYEFITLRILSEVAAIPGDSKTSHWLHSQSHFNRVNTVVSQSVMQLQFLCAMTLKTLINRLEKISPNAIEKNYLEIGKEACNTYRFNKIDRKSVV